MTRWKVAVVGIGLLGLGVLPVTREGWAQPPLYETKQVARDVYLFRYKTHNSLFIVTPEGVIVNDPISTEAASVALQEIRRITNQPVRFLIYSHHHFDHITGGHVFGPNVEIIAHKNCKKRLEVLKNPDIPLPTITFEDRYVLLLGGRRIELIWAGVSHSDNLILTYLPEAKLLFVVDAVANRRTGFTRMPDSFFPELFQALERMREIPFETLVLGHGAPGGRDVLEAYIGYWKDLDAEVRRLMAEGMDTFPEGLEAMLKVIDLPKYRDWGGIQQGWLKMNAERLWWYHRLGW